MTFHVTVAEISWLQDFGIVVHDGDFRISLEIFIFGFMKASSSPEETLAGPGVPRISMIRRASLLLRRVTIVEWEFGGGGIKQMCGSRALQTRRAHDPTVRSSQESHGTR